jgi:hypothetical protein
MQVVQHMPARTTTTALLLLCLPLAAFAYQQHTTIEVVRMIAERGREPALPLLTELRQRSDPGRFYVEGLTATTETEAIRYFRLVADTLPRGDWSDDALARIAEILFRTGEPLQAEQSVRRLKLEYPYSSYVTAGYFPAHSDSNIVTARDARAVGVAGSEYAVQVGAFAVPGNARRLQEEFSREGYDVTVHENFLDGKNLLYLVWVGKYATMEEALAVRRAIQSQHHIDGILRTRSSWRKW